MWLDRLLATLSHFTEVKEKVVIRIVSWLLRPRKIAEKLWGGILPKKFFPFYLLLVMVAGHFTNEFFVPSSDS